VSANQFHIVVVDDEQAIDMLFKAFFDAEISSQEMKISYVDVASKCLDILEQDDSVGLILSDINMPEMNGFEFLDIMKEKYPQIPVFMISAYGSKDYIDKAMEKGAKGFFVKPFDFDEIKEKVEEIAGL
jgi:DNA-binding NtrC family response regulator